MKKVIYSMLALLCAAFAFTSCEDVPMPYDQPGEGGEDPIVIQPTGDGTVDNPYNVTAALEFIESLGADVESEQNIYIKGIIVSITEEYSTQFGNARFFISDDGTNNNQFEVYRAMYLGNRKFVAGDTQIQEGDTVVVCGKVVNYKGTKPETVQNKAYLYSLNGIMGGGVGPGPGGDTGQPKGDGTLQNPYNTAGVVNYIKTLGSDVESPGQVYVKGTIVSIKEEYGLQFGNATFDIGDPGTGVTFTAYQLNYFDNKKYTGGTNIKVGDEVILYGHVVNFRGNTPEDSRRVAERLPIPSTRLLPTTMPARWPLMQRATRTSTSRVRFRALPTMVSSVLSMATPRSTSQRMVVSLTSSMCSAHSISATRSTRVATTSRWATRSLSAVR